MHHQTFEDYRGLLFSIAYRMLGTAMEAEDIVQDTYVRYCQAEWDTIQSHKYYLTTITTRLCINKMQSAHAQREQYMGNWLPEPILTENQPQLVNPSERVSTLDSISMAFLVLLENLSASERAVFILREIFDYEYSEIADIVEKSEEACRKLFSRAKKHLSDNRPRFEPDPQQHETMLTNFLQAVNAGNLDNLVTMLADDAVLIGDGGNKRGAATRPIYSGNNIARFFIGLRRFYIDLNLRPEIKSINGFPAIVLYDNDTAYAVVSFEIINNKITQIHLVGNDEKLQNIT